VQRLRLSEKRFQAQVVALAQLHHWVVYHTWRSDHSAAGFPDLVLARPGREGRAGRCIFAELKTDTGTVLPAQRAWLDVLGTCAGCEAYVWRPAQWSEIEQLLA
jgi:hypothetical protein